jgi:hypothetical protein
MDGKKEDIGTDQRANGMRKNIKRGIKRPGGG